MIIPVDSFRVWNKKGEMILKYQDLALETYRMRNIVIVIGALGIFSPNWSNDQELLC